jgi:hypothetical protein
MRRSWVLVVLAAALAGLTCRAPIRQDANAGPDGDIEGAEEMVLSDGTAHGEGSVSYPGGNRVSFRSFTLPRAGDVTITLSWTSSGDLALNLFDDSMDLVGRMRPAKGRGAEKEIKLEGLAAGRYYAQVYASGRRDAGDYELVVAFTPSKGPGTGPKVPLPPDLPRVPGEELQPDAGPPTPPPPIDAGPVTQPTSAPVTVEARIVESRGAAGAEVLVLGKGSDDGLAVGWTGQLLRGKSGLTLLTGADIDVVVVSVTARSATAELRGTTLAKIGDNRRVLLRPPPAPLGPTVAARIIEYRQEGDRLIVVLDKGKDDGVAKLWRGVILAGATSKPLSKNEYDLVVFYVGAEESSAQVTKVSIDSLSANRRVILSPPPPPPGAPLPGPGIPTPNPTAPPPVTR